ncbi:hypothetical protein ACFL52_01720 [Candidatus Margulisiibacteriota bacterium]
MQLTIKKYKINKIYKFLYHRHTLLLIVNLLIVNLFLFGCAKTVTPLFDYGSQMTVEFNLRGAVDMATSDNRYFLVLSSNQNLNIPLPPPYTYDEMLTVGDLPQTGSAGSYYTNYYSSWSGYIELNDFDYTIKTGPFVQGNPVSEEALANWEGTTSKISFTFRLDQIFGNSIPDNIYFNFISVNYPQNSDKIIADNLYPPTPYIQKLAGSQKSGTDGQDLSIHSTLDILGWKVIIQ